MATLGERLIAAVTQGEADSALFKLFTQGGVAQDVVTEGGTYPSLAKFINTTFNWRGDYLGGVDYLIGETFGNGNGIYKVVTSFTSSTFAADANNYELIIDFSNITLAAESARDAAQVAATSAQAVFDGFDDRYLGVFSSNPTEDNDGDALADGAIYWNTTSNTLHFYDLGNTVWVDPASDASASALAASGSETNAQDSALYAQGSEWAAENSASAASISASEASTSASEAELARDLSQITLANNVAGTTYTMIAGDEGKRIRLTSNEPCELTLIEFSQAGAVVYVRQAGNNSPTLGTLPTGMTVNGSDNFLGLFQYQDGAFVCADVTAGAQIIDFI